MKGQNIICHERLSIVDPVSGSQPLFNEEKSVVLAVNGEIYNHATLKSELKGDYKFATQSDCEVIVHLYEEHGIDFLNMLTGMFAFVLVDEKKNKFYVVRDHIGIIPLYIGRGQDGCFWISSELKAILDACVTVEEFSPGMVYDSETDEMTRWYNPEWYSNDYMPTQKVDLVELRERFEQSVTSHLMSDVPYGVLLSGGMCFIHIFLMCWCVRVTFVFDRSRLVTGFSYCCSSCEQSCRRTKRGERWRMVASSSLVFNWFGRIPRLGGRSKSSRLHQYRTSRVCIHRRTRD